MISKRFTFCDTHPSGIEGWQIAGAPECFEPSSGLGVAHDAMEHFDLDGTLESELLAFGAALYIRGDDMANYWAETGRRETRFSENMSHDLAYFLLERDMDVAPTRSPHLWEEGDEDRLQQLAERTLAVMHSEVLSMQDEPLDVDRAQEALRLTLHWMRRGYRKAAQRWRYLTRAEVLAMFISVEQEATRYLKDAEAGDELIVRLFPLTGHSQVLRNPSTGN